MSEVAPTCGAATTYNVPSNGAIYSNETVIIGGTGSNASVVNGRVTVTSNNNIVIGNNISYQPGTNSVLGLVALNNMIVAYWAPNNLSWNAATIATTGQWTDTCGAFCYQCGTHGTMTFTGLDRHERRRLDVDVRHARLQLRPEPALAPATLVPDGRQALHRAAPARDHASLRDAAVALSVNQSSGG